MNLKNLRQRVGLTQAKLAELAGVSYPAWRKWEYGIAQPHMNIDGFRRLMSVLDVDFEELEAAIRESMKRQRTS